MEQFQLQVTLHHGPLRQSIHSTGIGIDFIYTDGIQRIRTYLKKEKEKEKKRLEESFIWSINTSIVKIHPNIPSSVFRSRHY